MGREDALSPVARRARGAPWRQRANIPHAADPASAAEKRLAPDAATACGHHQRAPAAAYNAADPGTPQGAPATRTPSHITSATVAHPTAAPRPETATSAAQSTPRRWPSPPTRPSAARRARGLAPTRAVSPGPPGNGGKAQKCPHQKNAPQGTGPVGRYVGTSQAVSAVGAHAERPHQPGTLRVHRHGRRITCA